MINANFKEFLIEFNKINVDRCKLWHPKGVDHWTVDQWSIALGGEVGEALNEVKNLNRITMGITHKRLENADDVIKRLAIEMADIVAYFDLMMTAAHVSIDLLVSMIEDKWIEQYSRIYKHNSEHMVLQMNSHMAIVMERPYANHASRAMEWLIACAEFYGINLQHAVIDKFNEVSREYGFPHEMFRA